MAGLIATALAGVVLMLSACGGSSGTTAASAPPATAPAAATTGAHGSTTAAKGAQAKGKAAPVQKQSRALRAALTAQWRRGHRAGQRACAGVSSTHSLAHFVALATAAEKHHHVPVRAGMLARIKQLPKTAQKGKAAPAMAAALVATGMPVKQRAGGFAGCMAALRGSH